MKIQHLLPPQFTTWLLKRRFTGLGLVAVVFITMVVTYTLLVVFTGPRNLRLTTAPQDSGYLYAAANPGQGYAAFIANEETNAPEIKTNFQNNASANFVMKGLSDKINKPRKLGNKITFKNIKPNTDLTYETLPNGVKENIILNEKSDTNEFHFELTTSGATPTLVSGTGYGTVFYDDSGQDLFYFTRPFAFDASGARTDDAYYLVQAGTEPGVYDISLFVNNDWLQDSQRKFPIIIDPTIIYSTSSLFSGGVYNRLSDTGSGNSPNLETYYQELVADQYTVGLWHFNDSSGNALDSSGRSNTLTPTGTTITTGFFGNSRSMNGSSDYLSAANLSGLGTGNQPLTIEGWMKLNATATLRQWPLLLGQATNGSFHWLITANSNIVQIGVWGYGSCTLTLIPTEWSHVASTYDGKTTNCYLNGNLVGSVVNSSPLNLTTTAVNIGQAQPAEAYFNGIIDELRISNIARSPEEIKASAQRRPYSIYTTPALDFNSITSAWNPFSWSEFGVRTGDGETLKDSTGLIAQWNLNGTSGTTATNDAGSCGASCNGTLTNFASTASQDAAALTGWTSDNKRWGAGALTFDGVDDRVSMGDQAALDFSSSFTISAWINTTQAPTAGVYPVIAGKGFLQGGVNGYGLLLNGDGNNDVYCQARNGATLSSISGGKINNGKWHYVACVRDHVNNTTQIYVDGKLMGTNTTALTSGYSSDRPFAIGMRSSDTGTTWGFPFQGVIDSVQVYSRALTISEILSNYNTTNLEVQSRVGSSNDPNDGTWDAWSPTANESQLDAFDNTYLYNTTDAGLVSYWPIDEVSGTTITDVKSALNGTANTTNIGDGVGGKSRQFNGTSEYIDVGNQASLSFERTSTFSTSAWVRITGTGYYAVFSKMAAGSFRGYDFYLHSGQLKLSMINTTTTNQLRCAATPTINDGMWHHVAVTYTGGSNAAAVTFYIDGAAQTKTCDLDNLNATILSTSNVSIGSIYNASDFFLGNIDEVRVYNTTLTATNISELHRLGSSNPSFANTSRDTVIKYEGTSSQRITIGRTPVDANTVGLWHLEETSGSGAYLKDSSPNGNNGTPTGTAVMEGVSNKGRDLNGTNSDYVDIPSSASLQLTTSMSIEAWISRDADSGAIERVISKSDSSSAPGFDYWLQVQADDTIQCGIVKGDSNGYWRNSTNIVPIGVWTHTACTFDSTNGFNLYLNGVLSNGAVSGTVGSIRTSNRNLNIGRLGDNGSYYYSFNGKIDEVRISNVVRSANEINLSYRLGANTVIGRFLAASTDLSTTTSLQFAVAGERPGTKLEAAITESPYANRVRDNVTTGIWRLDETFGSGAYLRDSSGAGNHATPTGTTSIAGKLGNARYFNGSSDIVSLPSNMGLTNSSFTVEAWAKRNSIGTDDVIIGQTGTATTNNALHFGFRSSNVFMCAFYNNDLNTTATYTDLDWHHWACTYNVADNSRKLYRDGILIASNTASSALANSGAFNLGKVRYTNIPQDSGFFDGYIDEVRFSSTARSADAIRQTFEYGLRTHQFTIDFGAKLDAGNLIADTNDKSFTVDATIYGLASKGSALYLGDKIIIRENVNGTEYLAQGTVNAVTASTGAVTVISWDNGSTFPTSGFTVNASVSKWQKEIFDLSSIPATHLDTSTNLTFRVLGQGEGNILWLDDFRSAGSYLTTPAGSTLTSATGKQYVQFRFLNSSADSNVSAAFNAFTADFQTLAPNAPTVSSASAVTDTSIRWYFTDNASNETGFKTYDSNSALTFTCAESNLSSCTETGLTPNTSYTRKIVAYNANGNSLYSSNLSTYTLAAIPLAPTVATRSATTAPINPNPGTNPAATEMAIYKEEGMTCDGVGGSYLAANGSDNGATPIWQTDAAWGNSFTATGLSQEKIYSFCTVARNADNAISAFGPAASNNYTFTPISGNFDFDTNTSTSSANFVNRYPDGYNEGRYVIALDDGASTNDATFTVRSGIVTINSTDTLAVGRLVLSGGSLAIAEAGAQIKLNANIWIKDGDNDGWGNDGKLYVGSQPPGNSIRQASARGLAQADCNDSVYSIANSCIDPTRNVTLAYTGATLTNHDIVFTLDTATLIAAGKMTADCGDLRVHDSDGTTALSYWIEGGCNSTATQIWVRVPSIPNGGKIIYARYNGTNATDGGQAWAGSFTLLSNAACPSGWSRNTNFDGYFPYGQSTYGTTANTSSHNHGNTDATSSDSTTDSARTGGDPHNLPHTHAYTLGYTTATHTPPYISTLFCSSNNLILANPLIGIFNTTVPAGWTRFSDLDNRFPLGSASYGTTGGTSTHSHPIGNSSTASTTPTQTGCYSAGAVDQVRISTVGAHTHSWSGNSTGSTSSLPPYLNVIFGQVNTSIGATAGLITMVSSLPPLGWTRFTSLDNRFPQGAAAYGATGGAATHSHSYSFNTNTYNDGGWCHLSNGGGPISWTSQNHYHSISGNTDTVSNLPPYIYTIYAQRNTPLATTSVGNEYLP